MEYLIDNNGIGSHPLILLKNTNFTEEECLIFKIGGLACVVRENNTGSKGNFGDRIFGMVVSFGGQNETPIPNILYVQTTGIARFKYKNRGLENINVPKCGESVVCGNDGFVVAAYEFERNYVIAVDQQNETVDVWLS